MVGYASTIGDQNANRILSSDRATAVASQVNLDKKGTQDVRAVFLSETNRFSKEQAHPKPDLRNLGNSPLGSAMRVLAIDPAIRNTGYRRHRGRCLSAKGPRLRRHHHPPAPPPVPGAGRRPHRNRQPNREVAAR